MSSVLWWVVLLWATDWPIENPADEVSELVEVWGVHETPCLWPYVLWSRDSESSRETTALANEVPDLQGQLQELYGEVIKLVEEGDEDTARELIEANYEVVVEQLESGYQSMEQIAMLDILAQLRLCMGEFEEAEYLLEQVCLLLRPTPEIVCSFHWHLITRNQAVLSSPSVCGRVLFNLYVVLDTQ